MNEFDFIVFCIGERLFGVDALQVERLTLVEGAHPGEAISLHRLLGLSSGKTPTQQTRMTIRHASGSIQVDVDKVEDIVPRYPIEQVHPLPPLIHATRGIPWIWGVAHWQDQRVLLVDLDELDLDAKGQ